ncbi:unnamed protein product, partial [Durusdinium trenchii]
MSSPKRHKHGAGKLLKVDFSKEFESRGIPLEDSRAERDARELQKVASFFGMDGQEVHRLMGQAEAEAEVEEDDELCGAECEAEASAGLARQQWLHRPVTPRELQTARPPLPMSILAAV